MEQSAPFRPPGSPLEGPSLKTKDFVIAACRYLGLDHDEYGEVFTEIFEAWEGSVGATYLRYFIVPGILQLLKSPADFKRASDIILPYFGKIHSRNDGSAQFAEAIWGAVVGGHVTSLDMLEELCRCVDGMNKIYRDDNAGQPSNGSQYQVFVEEAVRAALDG